MQERDTGIALHDFEPDTQSFLEDVIEGLSQPFKSLPSKYFYDHRGSQLFDQICQLSEYYPTRTEQGIMDQHAADMANACGPGCLLIEYGSGSSLKTQILLDHLNSPAAYMPLDISREHLESSVGKLARKYPDLEILPVCADFTQPFDVPLPSAEVQRRVVYFPGSTIGNFTPEQSLALLHQVADICGSGGGLLIGLDLQKDVEILERAYNDQQGVTAQFNLNLLARVNRELDADFDLEQFEHRAFYDSFENRIEMHLDSRTDQRVTVDGRVFDFEADESICTEYSHKFCIDDFARLAERAGLQVQEVWTDAKQWFGVMWLTVTSAELSCRPR